MSTRTEAGDRAPRVFVAIGVLAALFLALPVIGLVLRAPWSGAAERLTRPGVGDAIRLSALCATASTAMSLALGVPLGWILAYARFPGRALLRAVVLVPLLLPPLVSGVGLLSILGRRGVAGRWLDDWFGVTLPFSTAGVIVAVAFVALPFVVITMESGFRSVDRRLGLAAATLGAGPASVARTVTLPLVAPSLAAGGALAWARSLGEFGATVTFAGNLPGRTQTLPLATFLALESDLDQAVLLSMLMLFPTLIVLALLRNRWRPLS
ncbi:MAG: molybdate ABC transporter permease subunit [Candidatus Microthrix sp.]|nr:molybdate ABC transporter permease subunit [Candidatus Microthrix sp.]MBK6438039.1 molybdate ABC transporter permease subunit [Candidatus Microthrix sp.]